MTTETRDDDTKEAKRRAKEYSPAAIEVLNDLMRDHTANAETRREAATTILQVAGLLSPQGNAGG